MTNIFSFNFKNTGEHEFNDIILPGFPFILKDYSYKLTIIPKTPFWRLGFRFSKEENIEFTTSGDRHFQENQEYKDIHLSIGERQNQQWQNAHIFHLVQYNIPEHQHILNSLLLYKPYTKIEVQFQYYAEENTLLINYSGDGFFNPGLPVTLNSEYKYFKVFAWADNNDFEIDCTFEITTLNTSLIVKDDLNPFKVGRIVFRLGDMFDAFAQNQGNVLLLPASTQGTMTDTLLDRIPFLGIPAPQLAEAGSVKLFKPNFSTNFIRIGYAYSVEGRISSDKIIHKTCENILKETSKLSQEEKAGIMLNLPLLGSGAGGLNPLNIALIFDQELNNSKRDIHFLVSIQKESIFKQIKNRMLGKFEALENEMLQKPKEILSIEKLIGTEIDFSDYRIDDSEKVVNLTLRNINSNNLDFLKVLPDLKSVLFLECQILDLSYLLKLKNLLSLTLSFCAIGNLDVLGKNKSLVSIVIDGSKAENFDFISKLKNLENLSLSRCNVSNVTFLSSNLNLRFLDLNSNRVVSIGTLAKLKKLEHLVLHHNKISDINPLVNLNKLERLDLSFNKINNISAIEKIKNLKYLKASGNSYLSSRNIVLSDTDDHLIPIKSFLIRQNEKIKKEEILPAKIVLLGNHSSGKSSLLNYLQKSSEHPTSTHHLRIQEYFIQETKKKDIPDAIFFDFGGQDYYHGIYRAFLSAGSAYLILWNEETNRNQLRTDVNDNWTQDFSLEYWLSQKKYTEEEREHVIENDPVLLIQTYADKNRRISFDNRDHLHEFENEFYISLADLPATNKVHNLALEYLTASIEEQIYKNQKVIQEPQWYIDFLKFVLNSNSDHKSKNVSSEILKEYKSTADDKLLFLKDTLTQFHKQGLILYYNIEELQDFVWLNPVALVECINKSILTPEIKKEHKGRVSISMFENVEPEILKLLCVQKVIFKHEYGPNNEAEYIIPNFLPLISEESDFGLLTFDIQNPFFVLKFKRFLPFGLINQMICFFGRLEDKKKFWRDTLLFTFSNKARILINLDFIHLEIKVSGSFLNTVSELEKVEIKTYLFYVILALYWDTHKPLPFETFITFYKNKLNIDETISEEQRSTFESCRDIYYREECKPSDLYISLNNKDFVSYLDICSDESAIMINVKNIDEKRNLVDTPRVISLYPFKLFTNKVLQKQQKVVISYSKRDLKLIHKFQNYLAPLIQLGLIEEPWYCTELVGGREWNSEIECKFDEADIIFFMISDNLMATKYVMENEVKNAIDRWDRDKSVRIVPILLVPYNFMRDNQYNLGRFTGFPYMLRPVTLFKNQNSAWHAISESIKIMINKDLFPDTENDSLNNELKTIFEKIVDEKWD
jgi:internalin A